MSEDQEYCRSRIHVFTYSPLSGGVRWCEATVDSAIVAAPRIATVCSTASISTVSSCSSSWAPLPELVQGSVCGALRPHVLPSHIRV